MSVIHSFIEEKATLNGSLLTCYSELTDKIPLLADCKVISVYLSINLCCNTTTYEKSIPES